MTEIYGLSDPDTGEIRYIGKASCAKTRLKSHLRDYRHRKTPVYCWIAKLIGEGKLPVLSVLETCPPDSDWRLREIALIAQHRASGHLLNIALGGDEPFCPTEIRVANARKNVVARTDDPRKARIYRCKKMLGDALRRGYLREDTKELMRKAARISPELFGAWANIP